MRGADIQTGALFSYLSPDVLVPRDHPLRAIRPLVNAALEKLSPEFSKLYAPAGRASIAPEKLLRALLLQAFYGVRSERQLMEQITYNMLFRWFVGLSMDAPVWDVTVFTKNRERLLLGDIALEFLVAVMSDAAVQQLLSTEHFSVDGTLIDAWASMKSFRRKDGSDDGPIGPGRNAERDFHGETRTNETHASTTDPDARLYRKSKGQPSRLCFMGHLLIENRNGLIIDVRTSHATGRAEREIAEAMIAARAHGRRVTLGSDKAYDAAEHVANLRAMGVTPHVAQNLSGRRSAIDGRTTRHPGYAVSQRIRKRIEEPFGWIKASAGLRRTRHRGLGRVGWMVTLTAAACNLVRLPKLLTSVA
ncbi:MAG: IS5 family transposase [Sphingomonas sp.]|nr:IS5 family transposase [Sphingomonas sp.]MDQ3559845.1 IS5 family transposase [Pseudomonadota bacterium]